MDDDKFHNELNDKELVLEFLQVSTLALLYMTEDIQKQIEFYRRIPKINRMAIA